MFRSELRCFQNAGLLLCSILLASTSDFAQEIRRTVDPPQSIISLAPAPRPQGALLARHISDATFEHAPANYHVFPAATVGTDAGVEALTLNFAAETRLTHIQSKNRDFVIEHGGTCREGNSYTKGDACSLLVRFNPQGPGHRLGFINISNSAEATPMSFGLLGNGSSPVVSFTPSVITTVPGTYTAGAGTIKTATNMAVDGGDILYVADTGNDLVKEIDSSGVIDSINLFFSTPASLAVDSLGVIYGFNTPASNYFFTYITPWGVQTGYDSPYAAGACTPSAPCAMGEVGMNTPANMSIDAYDDLIFEEATEGAAEMPVANISGGTNVFNIWYLKDQFNYADNPPASFAADANGNIYNDYTYTPTNTCILLEESLYDAEYAPTANRVAGGAKCGFSGDGGLGRSAEISSTIGQIAFDAAGNLYFADAGNQRVRRIDALTGIIRTVAGNGTAGYTGDGGAATSATLSSPTGLAVDSQGQVYIISSATTNQVLRKITTNGTLPFLPHAVGTTSTAKVITVSNTGNSALVLSNYAFTGADPGDFLIDSTTTTCILNTGATLVAGQSCMIGVLFKPAAIGSRSANLVLNDNTVNGSNTILLSGNGVAAAPAASPSPTSLAFGSELTGDSTASKTVTLTNTGTETLTITSIAITGTNASAFVFANTCGSTLAAGANCTIHGHFAPTATGAMTAAITITDNASNSPQSVPLTGTGTAPASLKSAVQIKSSANPASTCNPVTITANVTTQSGEKPTGEIHFMDGAKLLGTAEIKNGEARFSISPLNAKTMTLTANYVGDSTHEAETSPTFRQVFRTEPKESTSCHLRLD